MSALSLSRTRSFISFMLFAAWSCIAVYSFAISTQAITTIDLRPLISCKTDTFPLLVHSLTLSTTRIKLEIIQDGKAQNARVSQLTYFEKRFQRRYRQLEQLIVNHLLDKAINSNMASYMIFQMKFHVYFSSFVFMLYGP